MKHKIANKNRLRRTTMKENTIRLHQNQSNSAKIAPEGRVKKRERKYENKNTHWDEDSPKFCCETLFPVSTWWRMWYRTVSKVSGDNSRWRTAACSLSECLQNPTSGLSLILPLLTGKSYCRLFLTPNLDFRG